MSNYIFSHFVGIDVSKDSFTVAIKNQSSNSFSPVKSFKQSLQGFHSFTSFLNSFCPIPTSTIICMESTSIYYLPLLNFLSSRNFNISVINPSQIHNFAKIHLKPTKTDKIDAKTIAQFASFFIPPPSQNPLSSTFFVFKILSRQLEFISSLIQKTKTEIKRILFLSFPEIISNFNIFSNSFLNILLNFPSASSIRENSNTFISNFSSLTHSNVKFTPQQIISLASSSIGINSNLFDSILHFHIKILIFLVNIKKEIKNIIREKAEQIDHPYINIATTIKGIGKVIASQFFSEIGDIKRFSGKKKVVGYIGLDPIIKQSGKYISKWHISKKGNKHLRRIVYIMASNVIKYEEKFKNFYIRLRQKGKSHKQAVIAVGNKIVHHIYSMVIHNTPFSQNYS